MVIDHAAREARAKRREAALARTASEGKRSFKHPLAGLQADIKLGDKRGKKKKTSLPFSNSKLADVVLWNKNRTKSRKTTWPMSSGPQLKMNSAGNGGDFELDDDNLVSTLNEEVKPAQSFMKAKIPSKNDIKVTQRQNKPIITDTQAKAEEEEAWKGLDEGLREKNSGENRKYRSFTL